MANQIRSNRDEGPIPNIPHMDATRSRPRNQATEENHGGVVQAMDANHGIRVQAMARNNLALQQEYRYLKATA